jgi:hypothetical protein
MSGSADGPDGGDGGQAGPIGTDGATAVPGEPVHKRTRGPEPAVHEAFLPPGSLLPCPLRPQGC